MVCRRKKKKEYSKTMVTFLATIITTLAVAFIVFVCYEMHRMVTMGMPDALAAVAYIGPSIAGILVAIVGFYMWRAKAKSISDIEWEKTKQLTKFREKHPEYFTRATIELDEEDSAEG